MDHPQEPGAPAEEHPVFGTVVDPEGSRRGSRRAPKRKRGAFGCLVALVVVAVVLGGGALLVSEGVDRVRDMVSGPQDYTGTGTGSVVVEVKEGDTAADIGRSLKAAGVVASVEAFLDVANADERARGIQVGHYELAREMSSRAALDVLVDPANLLRARVTVPEGLTVDQIVQTLAKGTDFKATQYRRILEDPKALARLGLPAYADGNPEGYLFPATYDVPPDATAATVVKQMLDGWRRAADDVDLEGAADRLGYDPHELMTIASLVEAEARGEDMPKVARVIYNRLETEGAPTFGKLEIDATVNYALGRNLGVALSQEDLQVDSPYNTRRFPGLPPGPIEAAGQAAMEAAVRPADGDWFYYVTVDLATGETKFAETYDEFLQYKAELQEYCETSDAC